MKEFLIMVNVTTLPWIEYGTIISVRNEDEGIYIGFISETDKIISIPKSAVKKI